MNYPLQYFIIKVSTILMFLMVYFTGCVDKPTGPVTLEDYIVYSYDLNDAGKIYSYHPLTNKLDSFSLPFLPIGMTVSSDGTRLFIGQRDSALVVELDNLEITTILPYSVRGGIAVSPDNQYVAMLGDDLYILNAVDYSVIFHDTDKVYNGYFSSGSNAFYCAGSSGAYVYKMNIEENFTVTRKSFGEKYISEVIPSINGEKWFLYMHLGTCSFSFDVYDVVTDSIIFSDYLTPGFGEIELTPDGRYVFYTNPDQPLISNCPLPPPPYFYVYDVENNERIKEINTSDLSNEIAPDNLFIGGIEITPDGRWLVGHEIGGNVIIVLNIRKMAIQKHIILEGSIQEVQLYSLTCQLRL